MSSAPPIQVQRCSTCTNVLLPAALACEKCHTLVHAEKLEQLAAGARMLEEHGELTQAHDAWLQALQLLPPDSRQADWIRQKTATLAAVSPSTPQAQPGNRYTWAKRLGPIAPFVALLAKSKFLIALFNLKFLLSLGTFVAVYWSLYGAKFGIGFAVLILVHEMGHYIDIKRRGLPVDMPVFLPGLGAYVRWTALGVSAQTRAYVSLAGPLAGWLGAAACAYLWHRTGVRLWAGLAAFTAMLNILNLIPIWVLDGGQAIAALNKNERITLAAVSVLFAAVFSQPIFLLVAGGAAYRLFTKDVPEESCFPVTAYYLFVLAALGYLIKLLPTASG
jgi:Zn-dependent protease